MRALHSRFARLALSTSILGAAVAACSVDTTPPSPSGDHEQTQSQASALVTSRYLSLGTPNDILTDDTKAKAETSAYYAAWGAPASLTAFETQFGFDAPGADVAGAVYFNAGDLGIGREMHCVASAGKRACYVKNYGTDAAGRPAFGGDEGRALDDAARRAHAFATVAMTYDPGAPNAAVQFVVYGADGLPLTQAPLDKTGFNKAIPFNCSNCHGGFYDATAHLIRQSHFLPFDIAGLAFASYAGYTRPAQENELRRLNEHVYATASGAGGQATRNLIDGWYGGSGQVSHPAARFHDDFVPAGWAGHEPLYRGVVAPFCRGCHVVATPTFDTYDGMFSNAGSRAAVAAAVCTNYGMPVAEVPMEGFWRGSAPALFLGELNKFPAPSGTPLTCAPPGFVATPPVTPPPPPSGGPTGECLYFHHDTHVTDSRDFYGQMRSCTMGNRSTWYPQCRDQRSETDEVGCVQSFQ